MVPTPRPSDTAQPRNTAGWDAMSAKLAHLGKPRTEDVFGDPVAPPNLDDIAPGWYACHGTDRYEANRDGDTDAAGTPTGDRKGGAVVDVYEEAGRRFVVVIEDRMQRGGLQVRRYLWPVAELDPERCHPVDAIGRHNAARKFCGAIAARGKASWSYDGAEGDDFLLASALAMTEPERVAAAARAATRPASCAAGHCVDDGGECFESRVHIGVCCFCSSSVDARRAS